MAADLQFAWHLLWNPIAEYQGNVGTAPALAKTLTWGIDLSGSIQGAGGVGGLLAVTDNTGTYYPTFDGNGNISEYLNSAGIVVAHYEYDPFGRTTVATGTKANDFAHRFSTKPLDAATGLYYYGYRYYDPVTGRWPSRDPIEEGGGINLYGFVGNNAINHIDILGNIILTKEKDPYKERVIEALTAVAGGQLSWEIDEDRKTTVGGVGAGDWYILCIDEESEGGFWDDIKLGIEDDIVRVLTTKTHTGQDAPADNAAGGTGGNPRRVQIRLEVQVNTALRDGIRNQEGEFSVVHPSGVGPAWRKQLVGFDVNLWHELVAHSIKELEHPKNQSNSYILKDRNGAFKYNNAFNENPDLAVEYENKVRIHLNLPLRRPQYWDYYDLSKPFRDRYYSIHNNLPEDNQ